MSDACLNRLLGAKTGGAEILKPIVRVTFSGRACDGCDRRDRCNRGTTTIMVSEKDMSAVHSQHMWLSANKGLVSVYAGPCALR